MEFPHENIKTLIYSFEKFKAVYFRVPKAASTSLLISFRKFDNVEKCEEYDESHFKFAFVRNPFDRLASCFRHVIQKGAMQNIQNHPDLHRNMSFSEFVDVIVDIDVDKMDIHFRPQYTFIPEKPDFLGKFENLNEDYKKVCEKIGIKDKENLLHKNKTDKTIFKDYYTKESIEKVFKIYKKDFKLFGYERTINL
ncbi:hypothetical protein LCGC14_1802650 [marine sediment metagenome]|uniref:Sulfotransferase domain-containing protein n=1 Tax=marine sediment metagenome TaxID=412755 RepID=A0A0F9GP81_9ZZZZ